MGICECIGDIDGVGGCVLYKESSLDVGILDVYKRQETKEKQEK